MSKSLARLRAALDAAAVPYDLQEMPGETRTAPDAAAAIGCELDQIAKSLLFCGAEDGALVLFLTAGGNQVDNIKAAALFGQPLQRADPALVRQATGFAIGGVAPIGHLTPCPVFMDKRLMDFNLIWAAGGTPRHVFSIAPATLLQISKAQPGNFCAG